MFFKNQPEMIFKELLNDVDKFVQAIKQELIQIGNEIAKILKQIFNVMADVAAKIMADLGHVADEIVKALQDVWLLTEESALDDINNAYDINPNINARINRMLLDYKAPRNYYKHIVEDLLVLLLELEKYGPSSMHEECKELIEILRPHRRLNYIEFIESTT